MGHPLPARAWGDSDALKAAREALPILGESGCQLTLLRLGENAIYRIGDTDLILRVARPEVNFDNVLRTIEVAFLLGLAGIPVAQPAVHAHADEPMVFESGVVSVWRYYQEKPGAVLDFREFGRLLRNLHLNSGPQIEALLPRWDPLTVTRNRLRAAERIGAPAEWVRDLTDRCNRLEIALVEHRPQLADGVIHGDAHSGNLIHTFKGLVLLDLDTLCVGPQDLDLIPTLVQRRRFSVVDADWQQLVRAYGLNNYQAFDRSPLIRLRELSMVVWLLQQYGTNPNIDQQLARRVATLDEGSEGPASWSAR